MKDGEKTKEQLIHELKALGRKVAELEAFRAAEARIEGELLKFSHAVAQSPNAIIITDPIGNIEYVNPKFTEITGYSFDEAAGRNPRFLKSGRTTREEYAHLWATILSGREWHGEFLNRKKSGELFWEYASISPVRNFGGDITHFIAIKEDITERKRAEEALLESEEKFRKISSSAQDAIIMMDGEGNISFWNEAAERIFGYTSAEVLGRNVHRFIVPEKYRPAFDNNFEHFKRTGHGAAVGKTLELSALNRHAVEFPVELSLSSVRLKGVWHAVGIVRDISSRRKTEARMKQLQAQLLQSEKMASLGTLASGVAHEIKNPLAIILQGAEYLEASLADNPQLRDVAGKIINAVLRADRIVKGLLNFSRQTPLRHERTDILSVIAEALSNVGNRPAFKKTKVVRKFPRHSPKIMMDGAQMSQVFVNLFLNAADALADGGIITVSVGLSGGPDSRNFLQVVVSDNGAGISGKDLGKIFDPFFSTKQKDGNAGMGLSITKGIIESHNGTINIESDAGKGTRVTVKLPFSKPG